jgi:hypothetical protein
LKHGNDSLLEENNSAQYHIADLESELAVVKKNTTRDVATPESRLAAMEATASMSRGFAAYRTDLTRDMTLLCECDRTPLKMRGPSSSDDS